MNQVTTIDGREVDSSSEAWRLCCEAVYTLNLPEADRGAWLSRVEKHRTDAGRKALEQEMGRIEPAYLLAMANKDVRLAYLAQVERYRGAVTREWIEKRLVALWEQRKAAQAA